MKLNLAKSFMDQMKAYINPEFFKLELGKEEGEKQDDYDHKNILFEHQSSIGRRTGQLTSPDPVKNRIAEFYKNKDKNLKQQTFDASEVLG